MRCLVIALNPGYAAEVIERCRDVELVAQFPPQYQPYFVKCTRRRVNAVRLGAESAGSVPAPSIVAAGRIASA